MKEEQFLNDLNKCKLSALQTGHFTLICQVYNNKKNWIIKDKTKSNFNKGDYCPNCKRKYDIEYNQIEVIFKETKESLTIFEAELLYMVYFLNIKPVDYANYHKCIAGKEFINSIIEVKGGLI